MAEKKNKDRPRHSRAIPANARLFFVTTGALPKESSLAIMEKIVSIKSGKSWRSSKAVQWQVAWRDLKSRTSLKARERRKQISATGNIPISETKWSELELRVLDMIGTEYVEGSKSCADSLPEEDNLQIALESRHTSVLLRSPIVPKTFDINIERVEPETPQKKRKITPKKRTAFESAREQFSLIARQQADAMMMQAEAAKQQAEALVIIAQAIDRTATTLEELSAIVSLGQ